MNSYKDFLILNVPINAFDFNLVIGRTNKNVILVYSLDSNDEMYSLKIPTKSYTILGELTSTYNFNQISEICEESLNDLNIIIEEIKSNSYKFENEKILILKIEK